MNPRAIYHDCVIYNPTNNAVPIKYRNQKPHTIYKQIFALYVSRNVTAHAQSTSTTHFSCSLKCRRTSLYKSYHRAFDSSNQKARVRAITSAPPYMPFIQYTTPPPTLTVYNIETKNHIPFINISSLCTFLRT